MNSSEKLKSRLPYTVEIFPDRVRIIDQLQLPGRLVYLDLKNFAEVVRAIKTMQVRGAQAIGATGIGGLYLAAREVKGERASVLQKLTAAGDQLKQKTRPTAVNLAWGVNKMLAAARSAELPLVQSLFETAQSLLRAEVENNLQLGRLGSKLIAPDMTVLTHCNAGSLSGIWYGTATAPLYAAWSNGVKFSVVVDETRPQLQGARLTAWELDRVGIDFRIISDSTAGSLLRSKKIDAVFVGADRIAANGDTANKIGTYPLAVLAHENQVPFYVAAVEATIDRRLPAGDQIPIETRPDQDFWRYLNPDLFDDKMPILNPAFDVTPARYISKIITERGIREPAEINN